MEVTKIFEWVMANGGPSFALACGGIYYVHREKVKKEADAEKLRLENKDLVNKVVEGQEKRIIADHETRALIKSLIEKNGASTDQMREAFARMEANQMRMMAEIQEFKKNH